jgi:protoporphyrinogen/coproporphyrinogen III oxidase
MRIVVIGGGISGLACAWRLQRLGASVLLLEQEDRPGGVIRSISRDGVLFEAGPQSFLLAPALADLIAELDLQDDLLLANPRAPRYVVISGRLCKAPLGPLSFLSSGLISGGTKWRLLSEPFRHSSPPEDDESIAAFIRRKFGDDLLDRLVAPMVSGIYAGDAERLSLRGAFPALHQWEKQYGSVLRGMIKSRPPKDESSDSNQRSSSRPGLAALAHGNESLIARIAERIGDSLQRRARVLSISRAPAGSLPAVPARPGGAGDARFEVVADRAGQRETIPAAAVVLAAPARVAATLLAPLVPAAADLARIEYAPVAVVAGSYSTEHLSRPLDGFGFLAPRAERLRLLGTVWNSSLFAGRVPQGQTLLTSFVGGMTDPAAAGLPDEALYQTVESELRRILGLLLAPRARFAHRWSQAIPQYNLGHAELLARVRAALAEAPGLFLAGSYIEGPAIGACVGVANRVAQQATAARN